MYPNSCVESCIDAIKNVPKSLPGLQEHCLCRDKLRCRVRNPEKRRCSKCWLCSISCSLWEPIDDLDQRYEVRLENYGQIGQALMEELTLRDYGKAPYVCRRT